MLVFSCLVGADLGCFLRNCWVRRKSLEEGWSLGMRSGISRSELRRLIVTVLFIILVYMPISLYGLYLIVSVPMRPFVWSIVHGRWWWTIIFEQQDRAPWTSWIGIILAFESFVVIGFPRNAIQFFHHRIEWIYDHIPQTLQTKLHWMRKISEECKERRAACSTNGYDGSMDLCSVKKFAPWQAILMILVTHLAETGT